MANRALISLSDCGAPATQSEYERCTRSLPSPRLMHCLREGEIWPKVRAGAGGLHLSSASLSEVAPFWPISTSIHAFVASPRTNNSTSKKNRYSTMGINGWMRGVHCRPQDKRDITGQAPDGRAGAFTIRHNLLQCYSQPRSRKPNIRRDWVGCGCIRKACLAAYPPSCYPTSRAPSHSPYRPLRSLLRARTGKVPEYIFHAKWLRRTTSLPSPRPARCRLRGRSSRIARTVGPAAVSALRSSLLVPELLRFVAIPYHPCRGGTAGHDDLIEADVATIGLGSMMRKFQKARVERRRVCLL